MGHDYGVNAQGLEIQVLLEQSMRRYKKAE